VAVWEDVVATGLIGTDRRALPHELPQGWGAELDQDLDPARAVLTLAARHRAANRAGGRLPSCAPGAVAPPERQPTAGWAAHEILVRLLSPPQVELLNLWLIAAAEHGQGVSAAYWTPLAMVAARTTELDRMMLVRVLGGRGVWFVEQNPQWARLAKSFRSDAKDEVGQQSEVPEADPSEHAVRANPEMIMRIPPPLSSRLTQAVLEIIASGRLQQRGVRYAAAVGARLPLEHYELLRSIAQQSANGDVPLTAAGLRSVREALLALERTLWLRIEMHSAFSGEPIKVERLEISQW
jgi:hypothetical protein